MRVATWWSRRALSGRAGPVASAPAVVSPGGQYTHGQLHQDAAALAGSLVHGGLAAGDRVGILAPPTYTFASALLGAWRAGGVAVPVSLHQHGDELQYTLRDSGCRVVLAHPTLAARVPAGTPVQLLPDVPAAAPPHHPPAAGPGLGPLIIYTSGTTGRPKGVLLTADNVRAQVSALQAAWEWSPRDRIYNVLPLHHVVSARAVDSGWVLPPFFHPPRQHGLVNVVLCGLHTGACVEMPPKFDAAATVGGREACLCTKHGTLTRLLQWERFAAGGLTLFMAVPTVYSLLIAEYNRRPPAEQQRLTAAGRPRADAQGSCCCLNPPGVFFFAAQCAHCA